MTDLEDHQVPKERRLYIGPIGLNWINDTEDLEERLAKYGPITKKLEIHKKPLENEGFAFISILLADDAYFQLLRSLRGTKYRGSILRIEDSKPNYQERLLSERHSRKRRFSSVASDAADHNVILGRMRKTSRQRLKNASYRVPLGDQVVKLNCHKKKLWGVCRNRNQDMLVWRYSKGHWIDGRGEIVDSSKILAQMRYSEGTGSKPINTMGTVVDHEASDQSDIDVEIPDQHQEERRNLKILDSLLSKVEKTEEIGSQGTTRPKKATNIVSFDDENVQNDREGEIEESSDLSEDENGESSGSDKEVQTKPLHKATGSKLPRDELERSPKVVQFGDGGSEEDDLGQDNMEESTSSSEDEIAESSDEEIAREVSDKVLENKGSQVLLPAIHTTRDDELGSSSSQNKSSLTEKLRSVFGSDDASFEEEEGQGFFFFDENKQQEKETQENVIHRELEPQAPEIIHKTTFHAEHAETSNSSAQNRERIPLLFPHKDSPFLSTQSIFASLAVATGDIADQKTSTKDPSNNDNNIIIPAVKGFDPQKWHDEFYEKRGEWNREFRRRHRDSRRRIQKSGVHTPVA